MMTWLRWLSMAAATFALGTGGVAQAQISSTGVHEAEDKSVTVPALNVTIDDLEDMDIYGPKGEEVGEVDAVEASAQPVAVAAEGGGFLGMDEKDVAIGMDQLAKDSDYLTIAVTKNQLGALPGFDD